MKQHLPARSALAPSPFGSNTINAERALYAAKLRTQQIELEGNITRLSTFASFDDGILDVGYYLRLET